MYDEIILEKLHEKIAKECDSHPKEVVNRLEEVRCSHNSRALDSKPFRPCANLVLKCIFQLRSAIFAHGMNAHLLCNVDLIDDKHFDAQQWSFAERSFGSTDKFKVNIVAARKISYHWRNG